MEWMHPPDGIAMFQGGGVPNATMKVEASMDQVSPTYSCVAAIGCDDGAARAFSLTPSASGFVLCCIGVEG